MKQLEKLLMTRPIDLGWKGHIKNNLELGSHKGKAKYD